jgi:hypothetical protein
MHENQRLAVELSRKSACGAIQVSISGLETHNYLLARAASDLAIADKLQVSGVEAEQLKLAHPKILSCLNEVKRLQESLLETLNGLKRPATST